jgi:hypothetical protein
MLIWPDKASLNGVFIGINYADVALYLWREMIRVLWEQKEFHGNETLLYCFQNLDVLETVTQNPYWDWPK